MNIYCIRDRMLDYFQDPFTAPNDNTVMASVSNAINNSGVTNAISQAPHHFEIWRIATVDDQGHIRESREFVSDCSSLVRTGRPSAEPGATPTPKTAAIRAGDAQRAQFDNAATHPALRHPMAPTGSEAATTDRTT